MGERRTLTSKAASSSLAAPATSRVVSSARFCDVCEPPKLLPLPYWFVVNRLHRHSPAVIRRALRLQAYGEVLPAP